jgi:methylated-DNA-[protein]-cysteine S-methyltransferase
VIIESPVGPLTLEADDEGLTRIEFGVEDRQSCLSGQARFLRDAVDQLDEFFNGQRKTFDVKLALRGTPFQLEVWRELMRIPYGETRSYAQVAKAIGRPAAIRAVGAANGANPIPIIVPCHRVIGSNGSLTGFGGGIDVKRWLLDFEASSSPSSLW